MFFDMTKTASDHFVTVYHISPNANIQQVRGRYSPKFGTTGMFVGPKKAILRSWAAYVAYKKK